jgi:hypothetical protein
MNFAEVMAKYKLVKSKLETTEKQFNAYKNLFEKDFRDEIAALEHKRIERAKQEASKLSNVPSNVTVSLREVKPTEQPQPQSQPHPESQPQHTPEAQAPRPEAEPELGPVPTKAKVTRRVVPTAEAAKPNNMTGKLSKLYRKLCKKFHPDVCGNDQRFLHIQQCFERSDNLSLLEVAIDNGVPVEEYIDNPVDIVNHWQAEIQRMEEEINNLTHMIPWVWCTSDEQRKVQIRPNILQHLNRSPQ